ncbi:MAG: hypothetical protein AB7S72_19955 [Draconibacterium sp.]
MEIKKTERKNTRLESEGAEFLVLGNLLVLGVPTYKTYTNMPGYDLVATNPEKNKSVRIQVKSRYQTNWDGFMIKNLDADFVVLVTLNRGIPGSSNKRIGIDIKEPDFYIFPIEYVLEIRDKENSWGKITKARMIDFEHYRNKWDLIEMKLELKES